MAVLGFEKRCSWHVVGLQELFLAVLFLPSQGPPSVSASLPFLAWGPVPLSQCCLFSDDLCPVCLAPGLSVAAPFLGLCLHTLSVPCFASPLAPDTLGADRWQPLVIDWGGRPSVAAGGRYRWTGLVPRLHGVAVGEPGAAGELGLPPPLPGPGSGSP